MTPATPQVKGWCPGALRPMMSGDGLVVRVRPWAGRLRAAQATGLAALSNRFGNGIIDISSRGNLQLRGVRAGDHRALLAALDELALLDRDPSSEARRNLLVQPFWQAGDLTHDLATGLSHALSTARGLDLPSKFGFAVDCGDAPVMASASADIRIERGARGTLIVRADTASGGQAVAPDGAVPAALRLAQWFLQSGGAPDGRGRMARHLAQTAPLPACWQDTDAMRPVAQPAPGVYAQGALVGLAFGQCGAQTLAQLARYGDLRLTPWRMVLIEGATLIPEIDGVIGTSRDPRLRISVCTGAPGCIQAQGETRNLARDLAQVLPQGAILHVSGCAKGCARPRSSDLTVIARDSGYDLVYGGRADDTADRSGCSVEQLRTEIRQWVRG